MGMHLQPQWLETVHVSFPSDGALFPNHHRTVSLSSPVLTPEVPTVTFVGHLERAWLKDTLEGLEVRTGMGLLVDCSQMTSYEREARTFFVDWHRKNREVIAAVAIVTDNMLYRMIISAMSMASGQTMRAFDDVSSAQHWLIDQNSGGPRR